MLSAYLCKHMKIYEKCFKIAKKVLIASIILQYVMVIALLETSLIDYLWIYALFIIPIPYLLIFISWLVAVILYWLLSFEGKKVCREQKIRYVLCVAYMTIGGFFANVCFFNTGLYIEYNWNLLGVVWHYVLFYCVLAVVWIIGFICSIRYNEKIRMPEMAKKWVLVVCTTGILLLSVFTYVSIRYVEETTDDIYWDINYKHIEMYGETFPRN